MTFLLEKMSQLLNRSLNGEIFSFSGVLKKVCDMLMKTVNGTEYTYSLSRKPELQMIFQSEFSYTFPERREVDIYCQLKVKNLMKQMHKLELGQIVIDNE
jgi:hypothetical protein